jgi:hypothetical protein
MSWLRSGKLHTLKAFMRNKSTRRRRSTMRRNVHFDCYEPENDPLGLEIQEVLRKDKATGGKLRWCEPDADGWEFNGYCARAAAAYLFLKGEELLPGFDQSEFADTPEHWEAAGRAARAAGYRSCQGGGPGGHWWLEQTTSNGSHTQIIDTNVGINDANDEYPYEEGAPRGFMMTGYKRPADNAKEIIRRVKANRRPKATRIARARDLRSA